MWTCLKVLPLIVLVYPTLTTLHHLITAQVIHDGLDCKQYQDRMNSDCDTNLEARRTKAMLQEMIEKGEALNCPTCQVTLKDWKPPTLRIYIVPFPYFPAGDSNEEMGLRLAQVLDVQDGNLLGNARPSLGTGR